MKRGKISEKDRQFIVAANSQGTDVTEIAKQLDRTVDSVQKILGAQPAPIVEQVTLSQDAKDEKIAALEEEVKEMKQIMPAKPKGVIVMTGAKSAKVDEIIKNTSSTYFREDCMVVQEGKTTGDRIAGR